MNASQFMDKQIMDLSNSNLHGFIDLMDPQAQDELIGKKEDIILPSYDFQPLRPSSVIGASSPPSHNLDSAVNVGGTRAWNSSESRTNSINNTNTNAIRNDGSLGSSEPSKVILDKDRKLLDEAVVSEIDWTMKKYAENLLHALEGVSARLSQLETRTRQIENSVDDLKVSVGTNHGTTDGKLRQLENILREVRSGVDVMKDKQEILEAQLHLAKLQVSKVDLHAETQSTAHADSVQLAASAPQQCHLQLPPVGFTAPSSTLPPPNAPPPPIAFTQAPSPPPLQNLSPPVQPPNQFSQNQVPSVPLRDSYFSPPSQTGEAPSQQYQMPHSQQLQPPPPPPQQQQYQPPHSPQYPQSSTPPQQPSLSAVNPPQRQLPLGHPPEESPYVPSQNYPPGIRPPPSHPPGGLSQQFYGTSPQVYEPPSNRPSSGFSGTYGPPSGHTEPYSYSGSPSQYGSGSPMKPPQISSPALGQSVGSSYPQLPAAQILPHALLTASGVGGSSGSAGTGNRVPIDDVVDKVTHMGFPRDQVRATVRKLTENGESVDLNVVLDKLMNDGDGQPPRGWFGR